MTFNGEVKEFGRRSFIEENVRNLSINEMKVFFFSRISELNDTKFKKK